jgi:hypothetical protein
MTFRSRPLRLLAALTVGSALLSSCAESRLRIQDDFGQAASQDLVAQIADPDAGRNAGPPPPSSGARAQGAEERYRQDQVIQPSGIGASGSSGGYGQNGAGATPAVGASGGSGGVTLGP